jgi:hypothetical protein
MRLKSCTLALTIVAVAGAGALAQAPVPELNFTDPAGFYRSAIYPPADFTSNEVNASLQVYPFRQYNGDPRQAFQRSLLREMIDPRYQENTVVPGAHLDSGSYPGADYVLRVRFQEMVVGPPYKERMRFIFVSGNSVAILDAQAAMMQSWQHILPQLNAFMATVKIGTGAPAPNFNAPVSASGKALAGLYQGFARKFMSGLYGISSGYWTNALLFYVFSADGRVYRHYDELAVPGNDPAHFDFNGAQRADPENSGQYIIQGDTVLVRIGTAQNQKTFAMRLPRSNVIVIQGVEYTRQ